MPGPLLAADAAEIVDVVQQRVDQRPAGMPGGRMDHHPRRLVDDDEVLVLVEDWQRQRFRLRRCVDQRRRVDDDVLAALHRLVRLRLAPGDADVALLDQPLDLRPRLIRHQRHEEPIEAQAVAVVGDGDGVARFAMSQGSASRSTQSVRSGRRMSASAPRSSALKPP